MFSAIRRRVSKNKVDDNLNAAAAKEVEKDENEDDDGCYAKESLLDLVAKHYREKEMEIKLAQSRQKEAKKSKKGLKQQKIDEKHALQAAQAEELCKEIVDMLKRDTGKVKKMIVESFVEHVASFTYSASIYGSLHNKNKLAHNVNKLLRLQKRPLAKLFDASGSILMIKISSYDSIAYGKTRVSITIYLVYKKVLIPRLTGDDREPADHSLHFYCDCDEQEQKQSITTSSTSSSSSIANSESSTDDEKQDELTSSYDSESFDCGFSSCGRNCALCK